MPKIRKILQFLQIHKWFCGGNVVNVVNVGIVTHRQRLKPPSESKRVLKRTGENSRQVTSYQSPVRENGTFGSPQDSRWSQFRQWQTGVLCQICQVVWVLRCAETPNPSPHQLASQDHSLIARRRRKGARRPPMNIINDMRGEWVTFWKNIL